MKSIHAQDYAIHFNTTSYAALNAHLAEKKYSTVLILVDETTHNYCLPDFLDELERPTTLDII